uniref:Right handed beta helix domain-containing protein n=1 Tax=Chromera velia CCMP2878 TaxID=1169474 RepID=A0A0G4GRI1_9ALVE|eukprot:Cvel_23069.t1-p1 / transcript=Cvel_23069.t1 / gene=Cvel_23069 / organism=Chromera_velia_CCMP2878 / gene_product=Polygalacturonase QRT3, putative / transcript_product=Polygalacturonase QRT3, putative / location=Cvel_scaffold2335:25650-28767(+) / protein_length=547 / sequence_SO=supercontig / SO=protein_coding / is_pseudo=false
MDRVRRQRQQKHIGANTVDSSLKSEHRGRELLRYGSVGSRQYRLTEYGGDPSGLQDSSDAVEKLLHDLVSGSQENPQWMIDNITDLQGAVISLDGGQFLLSRPLSIPRWTGNVFVENGKLLASPDFPTDRYVVEVGVDAHPLLGNATCDDTTFTQCAMNVAIQNIVVDGRNRARGCVRMQQTTGAVLGPSALFLHFAGVGLDVHWGHEVILTGAWVGQYLFTEEGKKTSQTGIGVRIHGNDHVMDNVIVFSAKLGVLVRGAANLLRNVHNWNGSSHGYVLSGSGNRLLDSYPDFNSVVIAGGDACLVRSNFFLGGARLFLKTQEGAEDVPVIPGESVSPSLRVDAHGKGKRGTLDRGLKGFVVDGNVFNGCGGKSAIIVDEAEGRFTSLTDSLVDSNSFSDCKAKATRVRLSAEIGKEKPEKTSKMSLSEALLFPSLPPKSLVLFHTFMPFADDTTDAEEAEFVRTQVRVSREGFLSHPLRFQAEAPVSGILSVSVDQAVTTAGLSVKVTPATSTTASSSLYPESVPPQTSTELDRNEGDSQTVLFS